MSQFLRKRPLSIRTSVASIFRSRTRSPTNGPFLALQDGGHRRGHPVEQGGHEDHPQGVHVHRAQDEARRRGPLEVHAEGLPLQSNSTFIYNSLAQSLTLLI